MGAGCGVLVADVWLSDGTTIGTAGSMLVDDEPTDDRPEGRTAASGCPTRAGTAGEDTAAGVVPEAPGKVDGTGEAAAAAWEALELEAVDVTGARPADVT